MHIVMCKKGCEMKGGPELPVLRVVGYSRKRRHPYRPEHFMIASYVGLQELEARLADRSLGVMALRVLLAMMADCDYENRVRCGQKDLARELNMAHQHVSRAIADLAECGFIERPENARGSGYVISPRLCWKGDEASLREALAKRGMLDENGTRRAKAA